MAVLFRGVRCVSTFACMFELASLFSLHSCILRPPYRWMLVCFFVPHILRDTELGLRLAKNVLEVRCITFLRVRISVPCVTSCLLYLLMSWPTSDRFASRSFCVSRPRLEGMRKGSERCN